MYLYLDNASVYANGKVDKKKDFMFDLGKGITCMPNGMHGSFMTLDLTDGNYLVVPGFADVHVHLREPGFSYKETIASGSMAAAHGGYTTVCAMPNLNPVPDSQESLEAQRNLIQKDAVISVVPYASITKEQKGTELSDMEALAGEPARIAGFSDDGNGVQQEEIMRQAMQTAKKLGKVLAAHCEDASFPAQAGESEWKQLERDIALAAETGCAYHVCHVSTKESVELIRKAKADGVDITCETAPHYLVLDDSMVEDDGRFRMNPPIRSKEDREALIEALKDGTIDMIATDHAPHSQEEKNKGFDGSLNGIVGLETAFPVLYTELVVPGILSLEKLIALLNENPRKRFGLENRGYGIWELDEEYKIDPEQFFSQGKSTPFAGKKVRGRCIALIYDGNAVWMDEAFAESHKAPDTRMKPADKKRLEKQLEQMMRMNPGGAYGGGFGGPGMGGPNGFGGPRQF